MSQPINQPSTDHYIKEESQARKTLILNKLTLLLLVIILSMVIYPFFLNFTKKKSEQFTINTDIVKKNEELTMLISQLARVRFGEVLIAGSLGIKDKVLIDKIKQNKWEESAQELAGVFIHADMVDDIDGFFLTDLEGTVKSDYPHLEGNIGRNIAFEDAYKEIISNGKEVYLSEVHKRFIAPRYLVAEYAFLIKEKGLPLGILFIRIKPDSFFKWLYSINIGKDGEILIVDQNSQAIVNSRIVYQANITNYLDESDIQAVVSGKTGSLLVVSSKLKGGKFLSSFTPILSHGWGVVTRIPFNEVTGMSN